MAGIYVHIPFCKQACYYCDFHFSTYHNLINPVISSIIKELKLQKNYLRDEPVDTIYFGGGTPSMLETAQLGSILEIIFKEFRIREKPEITLEANPDDLEKIKLGDLMLLGINRLSLGIQSFDNNILHYLNRIHNAEKAYDAYSIARESGFNNINIDLIYAIKPDHVKTLIKDLEILTELHPEHISAYCLTIEPKTVFGNWLKKNKISFIDNDQAASEFELIEDFLEDSGYDHYETSNYARSGYISLHNSNYWKRKPYLGVGPSAHSFFPEKRLFNVDNNSLYVKSLKREKIPAEFDYLSVTDRINECIFMGLRTKWGCDLSLLRKEFQFDLINHHKDYINRLIDDGLAEMNNGRLTLVGRGKLLADKIAEDLILTD